MSTLIESGQDREKQQKKQQEQQQNAIVRSRLVAKLLAPVPDLREFLHNLVYTQAVVVVGTEAAAFIVEPGQEQGQIGLGNVAHIRPDNSGEDVKQKALEAFGQLIGNCFRTGQDAAVIVQDDPNDLTYEPQYCLITLLRHDNNIVAATAVVTRCRDEARAKQRLEMMQLVAGYFDLWMLRRSGDQMRVMAQNHQDVLQYASAISTSDGFQNAVNNVCNELASRTGAARVSVGWAKQRSDGEVDIKLAGLSHTEQFDKKQELSVQLVKVMDECVDQHEIVQYDPHDEHATTQNVTREAAALSRLEGGNRVVTLPMRQKGEIIGAMTLEFPPSVKPTDHETTGLAVAAEMLGPILADRHANDRYLVTKAGISTRDTWKMMVGPKYWLAKLCVSLGIVGLWALCGGYVPFYGPVVMPMYTVKAPFRFVSIEKRTVSVPFDQAEVAEVIAKPGDDVKQGDVLMRFLTRDLQQKRIDAFARSEAARIEFERLSAERDESGRDQTAAALKAQFDRQSAEAEVALLDSQIAKATIRAPISGKVMSGDLRDKVQSTMKLGEPLFEIAETGKLRVEISLNERDSQRVRDESSPEGASKGVIKTSSRPDLEHPIKVERIVPTETPREGQNTFTVYANLDQEKLDKEAAAAWLPGQGGDVAIDERPRTLLYQWTHRLVDWARLKVWIF